MAESGIKVAGLNEAIRSLRAIGVPSKEIGQASFEAGELVAARARTLVPVRSGRLRSSIKTSKIARKVQVKAGNERSIPYANPIHWGWNARGIRPRPFFTNALSTTRSQVYQVFFDSIEKLFQKYSNKQP